MSLVIVIRQQLSERGAEAMPATQPGTGPPPEDMEGTPFTAEDLKSQMGVDIADKVDIEEVD